jgi:hypothetical protein
MLDFNRASLIDTLNWLEDLEAEASVLGKEPLTVLEGYKPKIPMPIYTLCKNTFTAMKKGEIRINGETASYLPDRNADKCLFIDPDFRIDTFKGLKQFQAWFIDNMEYEVKRHNAEDGARIVGEEGDEAEFFDLKEDRVIIAGNPERTWYWKKDFDACAHRYKRGIYLLKSLGKDVWQEIDCIAYREKAS